MTNMVVAIDTVANDGVGGRCAPYRLGTAPAGNWRLRPPGFEGEHSALAGPAALGADAPSDSPRSASTPKTSCSGAPRQVRRDLRVRRVCSSRLSETGSLRLSLAGLPRAALKRPRARVRFISIRAPCSTRASHYWEGRHARRTGFDTSYWGRRGGAVRAAEGIRARFDANDNSGSAGSRRRCAVALRDERTRQRR